MARWDPRNSPAPAIGCRIHGTPVTELPCDPCRRQRELFPRTDVYRAHHRNRR